MQIRVLSADLGIKAVFWPLNQNQKPVPLVAKAWCTRRTAYAEEHVGDLLKRT